jgi:hypothetical protein
MIFNCPGSQKFKQPHPESIRCPHCGVEVEIWTDEGRTVCPKCRKVVERETGQSCLDWCKYAKECAGEEVYKKYIKQRA